MPGANDSQTTIVIGARLDSTYQAIFDKISQDLARLQSMAGINFSGSGGMGGGSQGGSGIGGAAQSVQSSSHANAPASGGGKAPARRAPVASGSGGASTVASSTATPANPASMYASAVRATSGDTRSISDKIVDMAFAKSDGRKVIDGIPTTMGGRKVDFAGAQYHASEYETRMMRMNKPVYQNAPMDGSSEYARQSRGVFESSYGISDRGVKTMDDIQAEAQRENAKRDKKHQDILDKKQLEADRQSVKQADAGNVAEDKDFLSRIKGFNVRHQTAMRAALSPNDNTVAGNVSDAFGNNPFTKYDPSLYTFGGGTGMGPGGGNAPADPYMAAGMAGLRTRAALQAVFSANSNNSIYVRGQQRYAAQGLSQFASASIGGALSLYTNNTASGGYDPMAAAGLYGSVTGGVAGAISGALIGAMAPVPEPGLGILLGTQTGMQVGSAAAQAIQAPFMRTRSAVSSLASVSGRFGFDPYQLVGAAKYHADFDRHTNRMTAETTEGGLADMSEHITMRGKSARQKMLIKAGLYTGTDIIGTPDISSVFASIASSELSNGKNDIASVMNGTNLFASRYGINAKQLIGTASGVNAKNAGLGYNQGDLMLASGPEAYGLYSDMTGRPAMSQDQLRAYGKQQTDRYNDSLASTGVRGVATARGIAQDSLLKNLSAFGTDTLAYKTAEAERRGTRLGEFEEQGHESYGLPQAHIAGQQARLNLMPFSPINGISLAIQSSKNASTEGKRMDSWYKAHKGELSEEQDLQWQTRREGLKTQSWEAAAQLSEGLENRLPGLASNAPQGFGRFNSMNLAALNMSIIGGPSRAYGAANGKQLTQQNALFADLGGTPDMGNARSTTGGFNQSAETNQLLRQILGALSGGSSNGRIGEAATQVGGQLGRRTDGAMPRTN